MVLSVFFFALTFPAARIAQSGRPRPAGGSSLMASRSAAAAPFRIVVIPDSQYLTATFTNEWNDQINWIIHNRAALNIKAVMHLGDLVDSPNPAQLHAAMYGLNKLRKAGVPLILTPGNHDQDSNPTPTMMVNLTLAGLTPGWYSNYPNYGSGWSMGFQNPTNLLGSYLLISNAAQPWLLGCTTWLPSAANLAWISNVFLAYSNVPAIYFQHIFVGQRADGRISAWSNPWSVERAGLSPPITRRLICGPTGLKEPPTFFGWPADMSRTTPIPHFIPLRPMTATSSPLL